MGWVEIDGEIADPIRLLGWLALSGRRLDELIIGANAPVRGQQ